LQRQLIIYEVEYAAVFGFDAISEAGCELFQPAIAHFDPLLLQVVVEGIVVEKSITEAERIGVGSRAKNVSTELQFLPFEKPHPLDALSKRGRIAPYDIKPMRNGHRSCLAIQHRIEFAEVREE
jgi:hypothetical protein